MNTLFIVSFLTAIFTDIMKDDEDRQKSVMMDTSRRCF